MRQKSRDLADRNKFLVFSDPGLNKPQLAFDQIPGFLSPDSLLPAFQRT
jgi:hypothetical protein